MTGDGWHWILRDPSLSWREKIVGITIASHSAGFGLSVGRLAQETKLSRRTVFRALGELEARGVLEIRRTGRGSRFFLRQTQLLLFDRSACVAHQMCHTGRSDVPHRHTKSGSISVSPPPPPFEPKGGAMRAEKRAPAAALARVGSAPPLQGGNITTRALERARRRGLIP